MDNKNPKVNKNAQRKIMQNISSDSFNEIVNNMNDFHNDLENQSLIPLSQEIVNKTNKIIKKVSGDIIFPDANDTQEITIEETKFSKEDIYDSQSFTPQIEISSQMLDAAELLALSKFSYQLKKVEYDAITVRIMMGSIEVYNSVRWGYDNEEYKFMGESPLVSRPLMYDLREEFSKDINAHFRNLYHLYWKQKFNIV